METKTRVPITILQMQSSEKISNAFAYCKELYYKKKIISLGKIARKFSISENDLRDALKQSWINSIKLQNRKLNAQRNADRLKDLNDGRKKPLSSYKSFLKEIRAKAKIIVKSNEDSKPELSTFKVPIKPYYQGTWEEHICGEGRKTLYY